MEDTHIYTSGDLKMVLYSAPAPTAMERGQSSPLRDPTDDTPCHPCLQSLICRLQGWLRNLKQPWSSISAPLGSQSKASPIHLNMHLVIKEQPSQEIGGSHTHLHIGSEAVWRPNWGPWSRHLSQCHPTKQSTRVSSPRDQTGSTLTWTPGNKPTNHGPQCRPSDRFVTSSDPVQLQFWL